VKRLLAWAALTRLYTVLPLTLLSYGIGLATGVPAVRLIAGTAAIALAVAGGFAYNDLRDQSCDRVQRPARPLVSGRLTNREAARFVTIVFAAAMLLAIATVSPVFLAFVALLIVSSLIYSDAVKPVAGLKNVFVGAWCGLLPWGPSLDRVAPATLLTAAAIIALFVTQKELVADVYDRDGDAAAGITTVPVAVGPRLALAMVAALNVLLFVVVRWGGAIPLLPHLSSAGEVVASVNVLALGVVLLKMTSATVRAYLELQKVFLIGGGIGLCAALVTAGRAAS
jgi:geranylgeranylglycerol-phosphate geranylgeranyltransferase